MNTRARAQASKLTRQLENLGAEVVEFPTIKISAPSDNFAALDEAIKNLRGYDWTIFTSTNGVEKFFERLRNFHLDARALGASKVAAIGSATAARLESFGITADLIPAEFRAESLVDALKNFPAQKVLIVRAEVARNILPDELKKFGVDVTVAAAYKTVSAVENSAEVRALLEAGQFDFVTFTSSSTVENFVAALGAEILSRAKVAAIGPVTAQTLKKFGVDADVVAEQFTIEGLVAAIQTFAEKSS